MKLDESQLKGPAILETLTGATVQGSNWYQTFEKGGGTTYVLDGKESTGRWEVRGDQYCSIWPPSEAWDCYAVTSEVAGDATTITWIGADGSRNSGRLIRKGP